MRVLYVFFVYSTWHLTGIGVFGNTFLVVPPTQPHFLAQSCRVFTLGFLLKYFILPPLYQICLHKSSPIVFQTFRNGFYRLLEATLFAFKARSASDHSHSEEPTVRIRDSQEKKQQSTVEINKLLLPSVIFPDQAHTSNIEHLLNRTEYRTQS